MSGNVILLIIFGLVVAGGIVIVVSGMRQHTRVLEMQHRERLALIERGLMPPPERDPAAFAQGSGWHETRLSDKALRMKSAGTLLIGFGIALATVITSAGGAPRVGIGIGGAIAIIGASFFINAVLNGRPVTWHHPPTPDHIPPPPPPAPPAPPSAHD